MRLRLLALAALVGACAGPPRAVVGAVVVPIAEVPDEPDAPAATSTRWRIHPERSRFDITSSDLLATHRSRVVRYDGSLVLDDAGAPAASLVVDIDLTSLESESRVVTQVLRYAFLEVDRFPRARLRARLASGTVRGTLELHGITRAIAFPATLRRDAEGLRLTASFVMNRQLFDVRSGDAWDWTSRDDVGVSIELRLVRERVFVEEVAN